MARHLAMADRKSSGAVCGHLLLILGYGNCQCFLTKRYRHLVTIHGGYLQGAHSEAQLVEQALISLHGIGWATCCCQPTLVRRLVRGHCWADTGSGTHRL